MSNGNGNNGGDNGGITNTIEEIAPDDTTTIGESQVIIDVGNPMSCRRCGYSRMTRLLGCHMRCQNCGSETTCSDI